MNSQSVSQNATSRLVLGTVQLGMPYGVANKTGQPDQAMSTEIIRKAWTLGIREFDTAQGYGNSETVLGNAFADLGISKDVSVISKFHPSVDHLHYRVMLKTLNESLQRLGVSSLQGMMLHHEKHLALWEKGLEKILCTFVEMKMVKHLGVSVHSPGKAIEALNKTNIDFVQLPSSILDRRFS